MISTKNTIQGVVVSLEVTNEDGIVFSPPTSIRIPWQQVVVSLGRRFEFNMAKKHWDACVDIRCEVKDEPHTSAWHRIAINCSTGETSSYSQVTKRKQRDDVD